MFQSCFPGGSHADYNLVPLDSQTVKEDARAVLMEGGLTKSLSTKLSSASVKTSLIRWVVVHIVIILLF